MEMEGMLSRRVGAVGMTGHGLRGIGKPGFVHFGGGLPDPGLHPAAELDRILHEILAGNEGSELSYGLDQGDVRLRTLIAERHAVEGCTVEHDAVVVTNGSAGAIGLVATALIDPGDVVVVEAATYPGALKAFRLMGAETVATPIDGGGLDPAGLAIVLEDLVSSGRSAKLLYTMPTCHNPTATTASLERRREVLALAEHHGLLVVEDHTYSAIRFGPSPPSYLALDPTRAIHFGSFSKTIAPGLRTGWVVAPMPIARAITAVRTDLGISPLLQRTVLRFVESGAFDPHLDHMIGHYRRKRDIMLEGLDRHCRGLANWQEPEGGFFVWLDLDGCDVAGALDAGEQEGVSFLPGLYFAAELGGLTRNLRLSYGEVTAEGISEGLKRLGRALETASG